ncbi:MAG: SIR2 family protein, partial [Hymenobacter sp.]
SKVFSGEKHLKLTELLKNILITAEGLPIITTNYDRLVEVAAEAAGLGADTAFVGNYAGSYNPQESKFSFCRGIEQRQRKVLLQHKRRAIVCKPHGSLDWYMHGSNPIRSSFELDYPRLIITPGLNKYRTGYDRPFDGHRE